MQQDKFKVIDERQGGHYKLCKCIGLPKVENRLKHEVVEIRDSTHAYKIGDILLIAYNEYSKDRCPEGHVELLMHTQREIIDSLSGIPSDLSNSFNWINKIKPTEEKEMQNHLVELLAKNFYTIGINFEHSTKSYTYKVPLDIKLEVDDKVIVDTTSGLTIVNVVRIDEDASGIDLSLDVKYKFIVQKLDTTLYDELNEKDKKISNVIAQGAREKAKQELLEQYTGALNEEQIKALEECGVKSLKRLE